MPKLLWARDKSFSGVLIETMRTHFGKVEPATEERTVKVTSPRNEVYVYLWLVPCVRACLCSGRGGWG